MNETVQFYIGDHLVETDACVIRKGGSAIKVEPKVIDLIALLADRAGTVVSRHELTEALWPKIIVSDDALPQAVSRLRKVLSDDPKAPRFIETIPKRGYRLIAAVRPVHAKPPVSNLLDRVSNPIWRVVAACGVLVFLVLTLGIVSINEVRSQNPARLATERADDSYMLFTHTGNETAIALYEKAIANDPDYAPAQAGLANALVQRTVRWPSGRDGEGAETLGDALSSQQLQSPRARETLYRAQAFAERAVRLSPRNSDALKALGLVYAAQGKLDEAILVHERAIAITPNAWTSLFNLGDLYDIKGDERKALTYFERAYEAMEHVYDEQPQRIGVWHSKLGVEIGARHQRSGNLQSAEYWYRRVISLAPLQTAANAGLARTFEALGKKEQARQVCIALVSRIGDDNECGLFLKAS